VTSTRPIGVPDTRPSDRETLNRAYPVYQTPPLFPYLDTNYVTRSTTNVICLLQENCGRQIALVVDDHRLVFCLCVRPSLLLMNM